MKSYFFIYCMVLVTSVLCNKAVFAQRTIYHLPQYNTIGREKLTDKDFKFNGSIYHQINDTLYASMYEVTNKEYSDFLSNLLPYQYEECAIDSSQWNKKFPNSYNVPMSTHYHTHSAFSYYPVVNVPYSGAAMYCKWLSGKYKRLLKKPAIEFRLPTENEWMLLAGYDTVTGLPNNLQTMNLFGPCYMANYKPVINDTVAYPVDGGFFTIRVDAYVQQGNGFYNIIGNAAEMTSVDGVSKGGGWDSYIENCSFEKSETYSYPDPRVGFRVFAVIKKHD
jgi:hypothetical protein